MSPARAGGAARVAVITKLGNFNAGNEALSACLVDYLREKAPGAELRAIDRSAALLRALARYRVAPLRARPEAAAALFDAMVFDFLRRVRPEAAGELAPVARPGIVAPPPQPSRRPRLMNRVTGALRIRTRLAAAGLLPSAELKRAANTAAWADVLVWNAAGEIYPTQDWQDVLRLMILFAAAARLGTRVAVVNHSIETADPVLDGLIRHVYAAASLVMVRGGHSLAKARQLGVAEERLIEAPDMAFRLGGSSAGEAATEAVPEGAIVIAMNGRFAGRGGEWDALADGLAALGRPLVFMSNSIADDAVVARRWQGRAAIRIVERQPCYRELLAMLAPAGVLVSSRLHSAVFALCRGVPVVAIEPNSHKIREILEQLDHPFPTEDPERPGWSLRVVENVRAALAGRSRYAAAAGAAAQRQMRRIDAAYEPLLRLLAAGPR
jgi:polysaccharide pyruvyl transferase WcaK-like protein